MSPPVLCVMGIDPGITGGIAFYFPSHGTVAAHDIPSAAGEIDVDTFVRLIQQMSPSAAVVEKVSAMRGWGSSSTFKFGAAYGALQATCSALSVPLHRVHQARWKRHYALDSDKEKARALALRLWPGATDATGKGYFSRKMDHGRAEAALIARYGAEVVCSYRREA